MKSTFSLRTRTSTLSVGTLLEGDFQDRTLVILSGCMPHFADYECKALGLGISSNKFWEATTRRGNSIYSS